jgi:hypothetical protein
VNQLRKRHDVVGAVQLFGRNFRRVGAALLDEVMVLVTGASGAESFQQGFQRRANFLESVE